MMKAVIQHILGVGFISLSLIACSDSGRGTSASPSFQVSGVAAAGAPVIGFVYIKDKNDKEREPTSTDPLGNFSFTLDDSYKPPFILKADGAAGGQSVTLYSAALGFGTANINPFTHLALAAATKQNPDALYNNAAAGSASITAAALSTATENIKTMMQPLLTANNIVIFDPLSGAYKADGTGLDRIFDIVKIEVNSDNSVNLINKAANTTIASGTTSSLPSPISGGVATQLTQAMTDLGALEKKLVGHWQCTDAGETAKGKEYLKNHLGYSVTFSAGLFQRTASFTWSVSNNVVTEYIAAGYDDTPAETRHETINSLSESAMQQLSEEDAQIRNWQRQSSEGGDFPALQPSLEGTSWTLTTLNGRNVSGGSIAFSSGTVSVFTGCNWLSGARYMDTDTGNLKITCNMFPCVMTAMGCACATVEQDQPHPPPVACKFPYIESQEPDYLNALWKAAAYRIIGNRLEIDNDEGVTILVFTKKV